MKAALENPDQAIDSDGKRLIAILRSPREKLLEEVLGCDENYTDNIELYDQVLLEKCHSG